MADAPRAKKRRPAAALSDDDAKGSASTIDTHASPPLAILTGDVLAITLSFCIARDLVRALPVCRAFRDCIASSPLAWPQAVRVTGFPVAKCLSPAQGYTTCIDVRRAWSRVTSIALGAPSDADLLALSVVRPPLGQLEIYDTNVSDAAVAALVAACPALEQIHMFGVGGATGEAARAIARHCRNLKSFITFCDLDGGGLASVAQGCPALRRLHVESGSIGFAGVEAIAEHCTSLHERSLYPRLVSDDTMTRIVANNPHLHAVHLDHVEMDHLDDEFDIAPAIAAISNGCPGLRSFSASACSVDDEPLFSVSSGCHELRELNISGWGITDGGLEELAAGCHQLRTLNLQACNMITGTGLSYIGSGCPYLTELNLNECESINDTGLCAVAQGCPYLATLEVEGCGEVTDASFVALALLCRFLVNLIANMTKIGDAGLTMLARAARLETLAIRDCDGVSDVGLTALARCTRLRRLNVSFCNAITDIGMLAIIGGCKELVALTAAGCENVTEAVLRTYELAGDEDA
jgi:F-box/leucine-rich repeat protein 2/20